MSKSKKAWILVNSAVMKDRFYNDEEQYPVSNVYGVYSSKERAENSKERYEETASKERDSLAETENFEVKEIKIADVEGLPDYNPEYECKACGDVFHSESERTTHVVRKRCPEVETEDDLESNTSPQALHSYLGL